MSKEKNSSGASQPIAVSESELKMHKVRVLSDNFHANMWQERGISFGEFMTIIESLGLPERQYGAVRQLIARKLDDRVGCIMSMFDQQLEQYFDYKRENCENVAVLK